jgi:hypothetical protein
MVSRAQRRRGEADAERRLEVGGGGRRPGGLCERWIQRALPSLLRREVLAARGDAAGWSTRRKDERGGDAEVDDPRRRASGEREICTTPTHHCCARSRRTSDCCRLISLFFLVLVVGTLFPVLSRVCLSWMRLRGVVRPASRAPAARLSSRLSRRLRLRARRPALAFTCVSNLYICDEIRDCEEHCH